MTNNRLTESSSKTEQGQPPDWIFIHPGAHVETKPCSCGNSVGYSRASVSPDQQGQLMETALAELREMFPYPGVVSISYREKNNSIEVCVSEGARCIGCGATLSEAMAKVVNGRSNRSD